MGLSCCPVCGKKKAIFWPEFWVYRRGETFYCSEDCMRVDETKDMKLIKMIAHVRARSRKGVQNNMNGKITAEQKARAIEMAIRGESPLAYLKQIGMKNPSSTWQYIKSTLKKTNPKKYAEIPEKPAKVETPEAAPAMVKVDGPLVIETPEAGKVKIVETPENPKQIYNPVKYDGMVIREVEGLFGRYRRSDVGSAVYIDFENAERMDTLSFTAEQWRSFGKEFAKCARILGVEM